MNEKLEKLLYRTRGDAQGRSRQTLVSVILYGSAAGRRLPRALLRSQRPLRPRQGRDSEELERVRDRSSAGGASRATPRRCSSWLATRCARSTDCFPIEFHDIERAPHASCTATTSSPASSIDDRFYRAQVEHELRAKLLRLRQKAAGVLGQPDLLLRPDGRFRLAPSASSSATPCACTAIPRRSHAKRDVVAAAQSRFSVDAGPFDTLLESA